MLPDISRGGAPDRSRRDAAPQEKLDARAAIEREYASEGEKLNIVHQLLRAHALYEKDVNYVVQDGQVLIVDEFTGRTMPGRRWSEGLHQAVEAKEGVQVKGETQTLATITIQNYFRMYEKLSGMTGTAETEETEFHEIYKLDVAVIPTNKPVDPRRSPGPRSTRPVARSTTRSSRRCSAARSSAIPVLVGTVSVDVSETLSRMFKRARDHAQRAQREVPPARGRDRRRGGAARRGDDRDEHGRPRHRHQTRRRRDGVEAVAGEGSGRKGRSTSTEIGGLHIIGSERHESRRIDRQLRGRAGRQGDPGASQFFLSLEDDLMRLFGSERIAKLMDRMGAQEGEVLTHPLITRSIEQAQKRVELQNFQARKRLLEYDDVMNQQREVIYSLRAFALEGGEELKGEALKMVEKARRASRRDSRSRDTTTERDGISSVLRQELLMHYLLIVPQFEERGRAACERLPRRRSMARDGGAARHSRPKLTALGDVRRTSCCHCVMLNVLDEKWKDHLYDLDQLRNAIHYRSWGQKDPLVEYKQEAYTMFVDLMDDIYHTFAERFLRAQIVARASAGAAPSGDGNGRSGPRAGARRPHAASTRSASSRTSPRAMAEERSQSHPVSPRGTSTSDRTRRRSRTSSRARMCAIVGAGRGINTAAAKPAGNRTGPAVGRNDPCPCGSGKKFKKCHGASV